MLRGGSFIAELGRGGGEDCMDTRRLGGSMWVGLRYQLMRWRSFTGFQRGVSAGGKSISDHT
jgi:hypothetical protein